MVFTVMEVDAQPPAENRSAFKMIGLMRGVQWRSGTIGTEQLKDLPPGLWVRSTKSREFFS